MVKLTKHFGLMCFTAIECIADPCILFFYLDPLQIVLLVGQGVLGGPRQKRPLDLEKSEQNGDNGNLVAETVRG